MTSAYADTTCTEELASFEHVDPSPATLLRGGQGHRLGRLEALGCRRSRATAARSSQERKIGRVMKRCARRHQAVRRAPTLGFFPEEADLVFF